MTWLFAAFSAVWIVIFGYVFSLDRKQRSLRSEIEDFRFLIHPRASRNGTDKDGAPHHKSLGWSLTVSIGVTERGEKKGWAATYWAVPRAARRALARGQKAGGNTVAK